MKRILLFSIAAIVLLNSCTDLDEVLYGKIPGDKYPENANQVANLSVEGYSKLKPLVMMKVGGSLLRRSAPMSFADQRGEATGPTAVNGLICTVTPGPMTMKVLTACGVRSGVVSLPATRLWT